MDLYRRAYRTLIAKPASLALNSITKRFGDTLALDDASIIVRPGTVHALLGENGAGKTTLMRIAFGMIQPDSGTITVNDIPQSFNTPRQAIDAGIGMVHQHFMLVPAMTVAENVALGGKGRYERDEVVKKIKRIGQETGLALDPDGIIGRLPVSAQQRVEIVKALARDARILILDEPTAVLAPAEAGDLLRRLKEFASNGGTVVLITHKLKEALSIADDVTVLKRGNTVLARPAAECTVESLAEAMLGSFSERSGAKGGLDLSFSDLTDSRSLRQRRGQKKIDPTLPSTVINVKNVSVADDRNVVRVKDASFSISGGEIVGVAGVEGSGQYHLLRAIAGRVPIMSGQLTAPENVGFIPEDRHSEALILDLNLVQNVALKGASERRGILKLKKDEESTAAIMQEFDVRTTSPTVKAKTLSGGNQQKLVVGRELKDNPKALIVENPTRGLDIQASSDVLERLQTARDNGAAVIVYSSDIDELISISDRILVVFTGTIQEVPRTREDVGRAMLGVEAGGDECSGESPYDILSPEHSSPPATGPDL